MNSLSGAKLKKRVTLASALLGVLGAAAGVIRYFQLTTGFEPADNPEIAGLAKPGNLYAVLLVALAGFVSVLLLLLYAYSHQRAMQAPPLTVGRITGQAQAFLLAAVFSAFAGASIQMVAAFARFSVWGILSGGLLFAAGATGIQTARFMGRRARGEVVGPSAVLLAVFWACAWLVELYQRVSRSPTLLAYIFPLLGSIFLVILFYTAAGYVFARARLGTVLIACGGMLFFGLLNLTGEGMSLLLSGELFTKTALVSFWRPGLFLLYGLFFAAAILCLVRPADKEHSLPLSMDWQETAPEEANPGLAPEDAPEDAPESASEGAPKGAEGDFS